MRMRGLEPPPSCLDTDLNRARLPIPPHPRVVRKRRYSTRTRTPWGLAEDWRRTGGGLARSALLASVGPQRAPPSSRGLGRRPLTAVTRVRIPLAVWRINITEYRPKMPVVIGGLWFGVWGIWGSDFVGFGVRRALGFGVGLWGSDCGPLGVLTSRASWAMSGAARLRRASRRPCLATPRRLTRDRPHARHTYARRRA
jgi:hypothetical protein